VGSLYLKVGYLLRLLYATKGSKVVRHFYKLLFCWKLIVTILRKLLLSPAVLSLFQFDSCREVKMNIKIILTILFFLTSTLISAETVFIKGSDGFKLFANYIKAKGASQKGVLMLHQCNEDKNMYSELAQILGDNGIHSLALDFRGYGESINETFSLKKMKETSADRNGYRAKVRKMQEHWSSDVEAAYQYLEDKVGSNNISFIGASCGGGLSLMLAKKHKPTSFTFFSSGMDETTIAEFEKLSGIPALIVASVDDEYTFKSSNKIFLQAKNENTRLLSYKGGGHGKELFMQDPNLKMTMLAWFEQNLK